MPFRIGLFSFAGGEYSPKIYARPDIQKYITGLRTCKNFFIHPHGGASNRAGFKYIASQGDMTKKARVVAHVFSEDQAYILEFGDGYVRFFTDGGQIQSGGSPYEISSPYSESDLAELDFNGSADVIYITHPNYQTRTLTRYDSTDWRFDLFEPEDGPFMPSNVNESLTMTASGTTGTGVTLTASAGYFTEDNVGSLMKLEHYIEGQTAESSFTSTSTGSSITCFTTWRLITHGTWTGKLRVEKSSDGGTTWTTLRTFTSVDDFNVNTFGTEDVELNEEPFLIRCNLYDYTSGTCNCDLTTDPFYQAGIAKITAYTSPTVTSADVITAIGSTASTILWAEGSWSARRGYPSKSTFYQDRLCLAANVDESMTIWCSKSANYTSFGRNALTLLDTDGISINLRSRQLNAINGLVPLRNLVAFTSASEWDILSDDGVFTPTTTRGNPQTYRGSNGVKPVVVGDQIIYIQAKGKVVRSYGYNFSTDSYQGSNLSVLSEHLFEGHEIIDMAYQQDDDSIVWLLRDDGVLLGLTYMAEQEVVAWTRHETEGEVESIAVIPGEEKDELWISVNRETGRFIEILAPRMESTDPQDQFFVDSGITLDDPVDITGITQAEPAVVTSAGHGLSNGDFVDITEVEGMTELNGYRFKVANVTTNTFELTEEDSGDDIDSTGYTAYSSGGVFRKCFTTFSGLDHLEGETVAILGNGEVYAQEEVSGGEVTIARACSRVHIGLPYTCDLETMSIETNSPTGTIQGIPVKVGKVVFRLLNARGGWIGPDENNLKEAFTPVRERLGKAPALYSGDADEPLGGSYEDGGRVFYRQYDPLPVTITAIIPEIRVGK